MNNITSEVPLGAVTLAATGNTPTRVDSASTSTNRNGVRICNQSSTGVVYVLPQNAWVTAPTNADLTSATGAIFRIPPGGTLTGGWGVGVALYAVGDSATDVEVSELYSDSPISTSLTCDPAGLSTLSSAVNAGSNKVKIEASWVPTPVVATGTYLSGAGSLGALMFSNSSGGALTFTIYDAESATGTAKVPATTVAAGGNLTWSPMGLSFSVGIHVVLSGAGITGVLGIGG